MLWPLLKVAHHLPSNGSDLKQVIILNEAIAESHLGMKQQTLKDLDAIESYQQEKGSAEDWTTDLAIAEAALAVGLARQAYEEATRAATHFASTGQQDSELRSVCLAAQAARALKDPEGYKTLSAKSVDILSNIQHTWTAQMSRTMFPGPIFKC